MRDRDGVVLEPTYRQKFANRVPSGPTRTVAGATTSLGVVTDGGRLSSVFVPLLVGLPAHGAGLGSGLLDQMGGTGARAIPLEIARPVKDAIATGDVVMCWISGERILIERLHFDHIVPWSYGGATNSANLLPADAVANMRRGKSLEILRERKIGWKWDPSEHGVRVPDPSQRLIRVRTADGDVYWSVPNFDTSELAAGAAISVGLTVAIEGAIRWRRGEFRPAELGEQAAIAAGGYAASYSARIAVKAVAPRAINLVGPSGVAQLGKLAGPVGFVAAIYGAAAIEQGVALARGQAKPAIAARAFALAPISAARDTAKLAINGYKSVSPRRRAVRKAQLKWRSIHFVPDLKRSQSVHAACSQLVAGHAAVVRPLDQSSHSMARL